METRELTSYHILRRNRVISYIRQHFVPRTAGHPEGCEEFCQNLQKFADYLEKETLQVPVDVQICSMVEIVSGKKLEIIDWGPVLFMREKYPSRYWFGYRCKCLIDMMRKLQRSIWYNPEPREKGVS